MSAFSRGMIVGCLIGLAWSVLVLGLVYLMDGATTRARLESEIQAAECWRYDEERGGPGVVRVPCEEIQ